MCVFIYIKENPKVYFCTLSCFWRVRHMSSAFSGCLLNRTFYLFVLYPCLMHLDASNVTGDIHNLQDCSRTNCFDLTRRSFISPGVALVLRASILAQTSRSRSHRKPQCIEEISYPQLRSDGGEQQRWSCRTTSDIR